MIRSAAVAPFSPSLAAENAEPGDNSWDNLTGHNETHLAAFADRISAPLGDTVNFYVATDTPTALFTADIYRLGWYGGKGGRKLASITFNATNKLASTTLVATYSMGGTIGVPINMVTCQYDFGFALPIPSNWVSGLYLARITQAGGFVPEYVPFVVTNPASQAQIVMMTNDTTWQAYNNFGAYSIYQGASGFGAQVSYDRPFGTLGNWYNWEIPAIRWLEKNGYDVTYVAAKDVDADPFLLRRHQVAVTFGHSEYWSKNMFNHWTKARDAGTSLAFFCANTAYKRIRWLPSTQGTGQQRVFACYEHWPYADPLGHTADKAGKSQQVGDWPNKLAGIAYGSLCTGSPNLYPFVCADASNWGFAGTGMATSDSIPNIMGGEIDCLQPVVTQTPPPSPAGIQTIGNSPVTTSDANPNGHTTYYQAPSGAGVFAAGTISWALGLDNWVLSGGAPQDYTDARLKMITANVLARLLSLGRASVV